MEGSQARRGWNRRQKAAEKRGAGAEFHRRRGSHDGIEHQYSCPPSVSRRQGRGARQCRRGVSHGKWTRPNLAQSNLVLRDSGVFRLRYAQRDDDLAGRSQSGRDRRSAGRLVGWNDIGHCDAGTGRRVGIRGGPRRRKLVGEQCADRRGRWRLLFRRSRAGWWLFVRRIRGHRADGRYAGKDGRWSRHGAGP